MTWRDVPFSAIWFLAALIYLGTSLPWATVVLLLELWGYYLGLTFVTAVDALTYQSDIASRVFQLRLVLEPRDVWIGCYWDRRPGQSMLYVCPIPFVVLILSSKGRVE